MSLHHLSATEDLNLGYVICILFSNVNEMLFQGCPVKDIMPWLDDIYKKIPQAKSSAKFYECKANVVKSTLDMDSLLEIFETAYINNVQVFNNIHVYVPPRGKTNNVVSEQVRHKLACTVTEDG